MAIITLTTDLGIRDNYVASLKASILTQNEDCLLYTSDAADE